MFEFSQYHACKHVGPRLADGGSIALVAGVLNRRPGINCVPLATVNGALEGLTRALALEFGPRLRVNCGSNATQTRNARRGTRDIRDTHITQDTHDACRARRAGLSPGFCDTERFDRMEPSKKAAMLANTADSLPLKRVGQPADMGLAIDFLLSSPFTTGVVLDCDGGHHIRQYASPSSDPMRAAELEATNSGNGK